MVIGRKLENGRKKILYVGRVAEFSDLHDLAARFNVARAVIDLYPETRKVREFRQGERFPVFGCQYLDEVKQGERVDEEAGVITYARTELCDMTHNAIMKGAYELPRRCPEVELYASQMAAMAKVLEEDERRGTKVYRYRKLGPDHYRHATNYFELAIRDVSDRPVLTPAEQLLMRIQDRQQDSYDPASYGLQTRDGYNPLNYGLDVEDSGL